MQTVRQNRSPCFRIPLWERDGSPSAAYTDREALR